MNKSDFINSTSVQEFVEWIAPRLDQPGSLIHFYTHEKSKVDWHFNSVYSAFEKYSWNSKAFHENKRELDLLSEALRESILNNDNDTARQYCIDILKWGKVANKNQDRINSYGNQLTKYLEKVADLLQPEQADTSHSFDNIAMNSGFTKIYSLIIDDFIIYDSRVGAALGMLVFKFCKETGKKKLPEMLNFAYGGDRVGKNGNPNRRNPGDEIYKFIALKGSAKVKAKMHIIHNIRANWLLKEILTNSDSKFKNLREIEAALFMIGYDIQCAKQILA